MNTKTIEKSLERAIYEAPSLNFNDILNTPFVKMTEHDFITRQSEAHVASHHRQIASALVSFAILLLCLTGWFVQYRLPDSMIMLDVNPSIKIVTNKQNRILSVKALNADAQTILEDINDNNSDDLDSMVTSIITSMINHGYLSTDKNVVMVSVENKNIEKAENLATSIKQVIRNSALSQNINPQILKQTLEKNKEAAALAKQYNVSLGKLNLIMKIIFLNQDYSMNILASMSMEELLDLAMENQVDLEDMLQIEDPPDMTPGDEDALPAEEQNTNITPSKDNRDNNSNEPSNDYEDEDDEKEDQSPSNGTSPKDNHSSQEEKDKEEDTDQNNDSQSDEDRSEEDTVSETTTDDEDANSEEDDSDDSNSNDDSSSDSKDNETADNDSDSDATEDDNDASDIIDKNEDHSSTDQSTVSQEDNEDTSHQDYEQNDDYSYDNQNND